MKTIQIPNPIIILEQSGAPAVDKDGNVISVSFRHFINNVLLPDQKFGKSMAHILSAVEIKQRLAVATNILELENADWERLNDVAQEPSSAYNPSVVIQLAEFLLAIKNAK